MKVFEDGKMKKGEEGRGMYMMRDHKEHTRHILPHERKTLMHVEFAENDWTLLKNVFGDEDTAVAAAEIIRKAPPEIQILAIQLINLIEEVA